MNFFDPNHSARFTPVREYQAKLSRQLARHFGRDDVCVEWSAFSAHDQFYSPRLDVAIGPFAVDEQYIETYDAMMDQHRKLLGTLISFHSQNMQSIMGEESRITLGSLNQMNRNARCFLAIEIENHVSRKHLLGGLVNASALGRVGVAVGWSHVSLHALFRTRGYFEFLKSVEKNTFDTSNLLILDQKQLMNAVRVTLRKPKRGKL